MIEKFESLKKWGTRFLFFDIVILFIQIFLGVYLAVIIPYLLIALGGWGYLIMASNFLFTDYLNAHMDKFGKYNKPDSLFNVFAGAQNTFQMNDILNSNPKDEEFQKIKKNKIATTIRIFAHLFLIFINGSIFIFTITKH